MGDPDSPSAFIRQQQKRLKRSELSFPFGERAPPLRLKTFWGREKPKPAPKLSDSALNFGANRSHQ